MMEELTLWSIHNSPYNNYIEQSPLIQPDEPISNYFGHVGRTGSSGLNYFHYQHGSNNDNWYNDKEFPIIRYDSLCIDGISSISCSSSTSCHLNSCLFKLAVENLELLFIIDYWEGCP